MGTHERGETKYSKIKHRTMNDRIKSVVVVILSVYFIYIFFFLADKFCRINGESRNQFKNTCKLCDNRSVDVVMFLLYNDDYNENHRQYLIH